MGMEGAALRQCGVPAHFFMHCDFETDWVPNHQLAAPGALPWAVYTDSTRIYQHEADGTVWFATTLPGPGRAAALCARLVLAGGRMNVPVNPRFDERYRDFKFCVNVDRACSAYVWPIRCPLLDGLGLRAGRRNLPREVPAELLAKLEAFWRKADLTRLH